MIPDYFEEAKSFVEGDAYRVSRDAVEALINEIAEVRERAERAESVVSVAREFRQWCANGHGMYANAIKPICAAIDALDAKPAQEGD